MGIRFKKLVTALTGRPLARVVFGERVVWVHYTRSDYADHPEGANEGWFKLSESTYFLRKDENKVAWQGNSGTLYPVGRWKRWRWYPPWNKPREFNLKAKPKDGDLR